MGFIPFHFGFGFIHFQVDGTLVQEAPPDEPPSTVPEPGSLALVLTGVVAGMQRLRTRARAASR
jgi:hypothetical protein